jgi:hypothetical protein
MAKRRSNDGKKPHLFRNKLVLNQWLTGLLGVDPLQDHKINGRTVRPFHALAEPIRDARMEGLDESNVHRFFHNLVNSQMFPLGKIDKLQLLKYEENIVAHTQKINEKRTRPITWKYPQWLTLLFVEIYLDRYFTDRAGLLKDLNEYVDRFNQKWPDYAPMPAYTEDDLNKLCFQNATGSGKTLIMHVNLLQYQHYSKQAGKENELSRVILLTPNERLSEQHLAEFAASSVAVEWFVGGRNTLFTQEAKGLKRVDVLEITKLADQDGPNTIATRSLGDQNLLLVDEGHRGMSGKEEGVWVGRRNALCAKGFTFEYSATFAEAVAAAKDEKVESIYAKAIIFDYSYRYFYEDGFGKDYHILNLPGASKQDKARLFKSDGSEAEKQKAAVYLTACLLKFYQQLRIYEERRVEFGPFNMERPLWVFVGSSVVKATGTEDEKSVASDVAQVLRFVANFLHQPSAAKLRIGQILSGTGQDTGLLDEDGTDIFAGAFTYLARAVNAGETADALYQDILRRIFNNPAGGTLVLSRIKGDSGEIALKAGAAEQPFGLINVGDAAGLAKHCEEVLDGVVEVEDSEFSQAMFAGVKDSGSPVNLLIGSKKFIEGWDCWRVSTMGLMHVGKSEGSQIIQLFGRGVRLKGYQWSLKRSGHSFAPTHPQFIEELETLNIFGIEADFMQRFREFLKEEGLPGNERKAIFTIPLAVTDDFGKKLKILRPKQKVSDGREYDFKRDGRVPTIGEVPEYIPHNTIVADWYPRIQAVASRGNTDTRTRAKGTLGPQHLAMLNYDALYFELEKFKRERSWYNLNVPKEAIRPLLADASWYTLYIPPARLEPSGWDNVRLWQDVAAELLKRYCDHYYNYRKSEFIEPRLELRDLTRADDNLPQDDAYQLIVDGSEEQVIQGIKEIQKELKDKKKDLLQHGDLHACVFGPHLYQPLFHVRRGGKIQVLPVALNESEYQFLQDLKKHCEDHKDDFKAAKRELFLLRNMSRGHGVGFFEARNFHPDFIMWVLEGGKQYVTFIEPHGLMHEGPGSPKVLFHQTVKGVEQRLNDPKVVLDSFILSWTRHGQLDWGLTRDQLKAKHVLFMTEDRATYIGEMFGMLAPAEAGSK